jgi:hypothetical protein
VSAIAWTHHGYEGWSPTPFPSEADLLAWIEGGGGYGSRFVITRGLLALAVAPPRPGEER